MLLLRSFVFVLLLVEKRERKEREREKSFSSCVSILIFFFIRSHFLFSIFSILHCVHQASQPSCWSCLFFLSLFHFSTFLRWKKTNTNRSSITHSPPCRSPVQTCAPCCFLMSTSTTTSSSRQAHEHTFVLSFYWAMWCASVVSSDGSSCATKSIQWERERERDWLSIFESYQLTLVTCSTLSPFPFPYFGFERVLFPSLDRIWCMIDQQHVFSFFSWTNRVHHHKGKYVRWCDTAVSDGERQRLLLLLLPLSKKVHYHIVQERMLSTRSDYNSFAFRGCRHTHTHPHTRKEEAACCSYSRSLSFSLSLSLYSIPVFFSFSFFCSFLRLLLLDFLLLSRSVLTTNILVSVSARSAIDDKDKTRSLTSSQLFCGRTRLPDPSLHWFKCSHRLRYVKDRDASIGDHQLNLSLGEKGFPLLLTVPVGNRINRRWWRVKSEGIAKADVPGEKIAPQKIFLEN